MYVGALYSLSGICKVSWGCPDPKYHSMQGGWEVGGPKLNLLLTIIYSQMCQFGIFGHFGGSPLVSLIVKEHWLKSNLLPRLIYFIMVSTFFELLVRSLI